MPGRSLTAVAEDQALPGLASALDPDHMASLLNEAAGLGGETRADVVWSADVIKHDLGKRCTIRYQPSQANVPAIIGKLYRSKRRAARVHQAVQSLRVGPFDGDGPLRLPASLSLAPELRLVMQEHAPGEDLRHALARGDAAGPVTLAARWLAALHSAEAPVGLKPTTVKHEVEKLDHWCEKIAPELDANDGQRLVAPQDRLRAAQETLRAMAAEIDDKSRAPIHKDFYYAHVFWDGDNVWVIDFDQLSTGDPAFDVGHFTAHLENLAFRATGDPSAYEDASRLFASTYEQHATETVGGRLPFYRAYTFLKLAATEVRRQRVDWAERTRVLAGLAFREAEDSAWKRIS